MANFCPNCGQAVSPEDTFCVSCGAKLKDEAAAVQPVREVQAQQAYYEPQPAPQEPVYAGNGTVREGIPRPGFSDRVNDPEIMAAAKKNRRASKISAFFIVPLPLIGVAVYAAVTGKMEMAEAIRGGGFVSLVFLVFAVYSFIKGSANKSYEAVVTSKYTKERADKTRDSSGSRFRSVDYDYITVAQTTTGKTKKIVETDHGTIWAYDHLKVGDRFRYHPQFVFPYELFDKTQLDSLRCVACGTKNPLTADRCKRCNVPLLK